MVANRGPKPDKLWADLTGMKRLWPFLKDEKRYIVVAAILIPVISALQMALPIVLKRTIDEGTMKGATSVIITGAIVYFFVVIGEYASRATQTMVSALAVHRMIMTMRRELMRHVLRLRASFHDRSLSGALVTRATSDFDNLSESLNQGVLTSIVDLAVLLGACVGLLLLNWKLALCTIAVLPFVAFIVQRFSAGLKRAMLSARVKIAALNAFLQECLYGVTTVKLLTGEAEAGRRFDKMSIEYRDAQMQSVVLDAMMFAILDGIASITVGIVLWMAVGLVTDGVTAGMMVAFVQYIQNLFEPLKNLGNKIAMLQGAFTSLERIFGIMDTQEFVGGQEPVTAVLGDIEFDHVSFGYEREGGARVSVLHDVCFRVARGESLALVGPTGAGKSTIVKLLSKLYDGYEGRIMLDGRDLSKISGVALRAHMAIVPQDIVLFDGSIAFNIGLGSPDVARTAIERAATIVGADGFIHALPGAYDFEIKEQGSNLSHGQRQLIVFARALARNPKVVILDEATSSVDPVAEQLIQTAIESMLDDRTVIVIAHRLSTIRRCDQILVIASGCIAEAGTHDSLMSRRGIYHGLSTGASAV